MVMVRTAARAGLFIFTVMHYYTIKEHSGGGLKKFQEEDAYYGIRLFSIPNKSLDNINYFMLKNLLK
jgi:hypothetical protein